SDCEQAIRQQTARDYKSAKSSWENILLTFNLDILQKFKQNFSKHIDACNEMIDNQNKNSTYENKGKTALENGEYEKAVEYFRKSQELCQKMGLNDKLSHITELINKTIRKLNESVDFHGEKLLYKEKKIMMEIETKMNEAGRKLKEYKPGLFGNAGFIISNNHVKELHLGYERFSPVPDSIGSLPYLEILDLEGNKLSSIPRTIGFLKRLKILNLSSNQLTSVPETICSLSALEKLNLWNNELTSLPDAIGDLRSLQNLKLNNNKLTSLPESIGSLKSLEELDLRYNKLRFLPESIGSLISLKHLTCEKNKLSSLPKSIGSLKSLNSLNLAGNYSLSISEDVKEQLKKLNLSKFCRSCGIKLNQGQICCHNCGKYIFE
ncbi:MAG: hypothetical protein GF364_09815, partial [Candidatus Lokiarchaeota archaeon]|nr:hypothetical protein [Candidatus Lokiarchaeota archaeon]